MRDALPKKSKKIECGVLNLDDSKNEGTHWVAYVKVNDYCEYFDSYGDLKPPLELNRYLNNPNMFYNYDRYQRYDAVNCGHLCLKYLENFWNNYII